MKHRKNSYHFSVKKTLLGVNLYFLPDAGQNSSYHFQEARKKFFFFLFKLLVFSTFWTEVWKAPAAALSLSAEGATAELPPVSPAQSFPAPPPPIARGPAPTGLGAGTPGAAPDSDWADCRFRGAVVSAPESHPSRAGS